MTEEHRQALDQCNLDQHESGADENEVAGTPPERTCVFLRLPLRPAAREERDNDG